MNEKKNPAENKNHSQENPQKRWTAKRVIAMVAVVLLLALYVITFLSAAFSRPGTGKLFRFCLGMTIAVPIFAWIAIGAIGAMNHRHTIASMDILNSNEEARKEMEEGIQREQKAESSSKADSSDK